MNKNGVNLMNEVRVQVDLLVDTLTKKKQLLTEIRKYTVDQKALLAIEDFDLRAFNNIMSNKQVRIDMLAKLDDGFEVAFERVRNVLSTQPDIYREAILSMKSLIKEVSDLGIDIQVQEERNRINFESKSKGLKSEVKSFRTHKSAMKKYQNTYNSQKKAGEPHFFDSKK